MPTAIIIKDAMAHPIRNPREAPQVVKTRFPPEATAMSIPPIVMSGSRRRLAMISWFPRFRFSMHAQVLSGTLAQSRATLDECPATRNVSLWK
jgi:hypothetical protein